MIIRKTHNSPSCEKTKNKLSPRGKIRYERLIAAATEVFLEKGFAETNMNEIVKRGGGSLATAYKLFGSKEELFMKMLSQNVEKIFSDIKHSNVSYEGQFEVFLYDIGKKFLTMILDDKVYIFHRFVVQEGHKNNSKLGKIFFENAVKKTSQVVAEYFAQEKAKGNIDVDDTMLAAHQFLQVVKEPFFFMKILGLDISESDLDIEKTLKQTIKIFAKGMLKNNVPLLK